MRDKQKGKIFTLRYKQKQDKDRRQRVPLPLEENDMLFEMANLHKEETGLPYNIWLDSQGIDRQTKHNLPRLKVDVDGDKIPEISVSIDTQNPQALQNEYQGFRFEKEIFDWIIKNYEVLIAHWDHKITDRKALILLGHDEIQDISAKGEGAM